MKEVETSRNFYSAKSAMLRGYVFIVKIPIVIKFSLKKKNASRRIDSEPCTCTVNFLFLGLAELGKIAECNHLAQRFED